MLYISGPKDTLKDLMEKEGFEGPLSDYQKWFAEINPQIAKDFKYLKQLPSYMPMLLVTQPFDATKSGLAVNEIREFSLNERQSLRDMQENGHDTLAVMSLTDVLNEFRTYLTGVKDDLNAPLVSTPSPEFNKSLKQKSLIKLTGETAKYGSGLFERSPRFTARNLLFENMKKRTLLNVEWYELQGKKTAAAIKARGNVETQIKALTKEIKQQITKNIDAASTKYVLPGFKPEEAKKLRSNAASAKLARKGATVVKATHLDMLNKTGLGRLRAMTKELKMLGEGINKGATYLNYGLAAYEINEAYLNGGNVARTAFREGTALYVTTAVGAAAGGITGLGAIGVGTIATLATGGDVVLGSALASSATTILVCYPIIGWVILAVAGAAVGGYVTYQAKRASEGAWDAAESGYITDKVCEYAGWIFDQVKMLGQQILKNGKYD